MTIETLSSAESRSEDSRASPRDTIKSSNESFLKSHSNFTNLKITINHWQLRNLVQSCSTDPSKILFTCKDQLRSYNYTTNKITNYCKLDFQPRCFAEQDGIILSGGVASNHSSQSINITSSLGHSKGLLNLYNKELDINNSISVGSLINNHVSLDKHSNYKYHSLVCNNDYCLYSCSINNRGDIVVENETNLGFAVNHASLSPDKKSIVTCGDSKRIGLLHESASNGGKSWSPHKKISMKTSYDSGISTAFSPDGKQFSCAFQDGVTLVYDIRSYKKPLHTIYSTRPKTAHGAFRSCKFTGGTDDLLVLSEHTGRIHLVDTRNFEKHQVVLLPKLIYAPGDNSKEGVYHEPLVREYQDVLSNFNNNPDNICYSTNNSNNNEYLYASNGIASSHSPYSRYELSNNSNNNDDTECNFAEDDDFEGRNTTENEDWSEYDQETTADSSRSSEGFYTNSNSLFYVNNQFPGRRITPGRSADDNSELRAMYEDSAVDINGVDWYYDPDTGKSHLLIGCDKGLFRWEVDSWSRRCFPSFQIC